METVIKMNQASPGMVVASDVVDRNGRVLLLSGNTLTEKHLKVFKSWGVVELRVAADSGAGGAAAVSTAEEAPAPGGEASRHVEDLFRFTDREHPAIRELMSIVLLRNKEKSS